MSPIDIGGLGSCGQDHSPYFIIGKTGKAKLQKREIISLGLRGGLDQGSRALITCAQTRSPRYYVTETDELFQGSWLSSSFLLTLLPLTAPLNTKGKIII